MTKRIRRPLEDDSPSVANGPNPDHSRDSRGRFQPGNRAAVGRRPARGIARRAILEQLTGERLERVIDRLIRRAERGDERAARLLFERVDGKPRPERDDERSELDLGDLHDLESCAAAQRTITAAASAGTISIEHAMRLSRLVEKTAERHRDSDLEERIAQLEANQ